MPPSHDMENVPTADEGSRDFSLDQLVAYRFSMLSNSMAKIATGYIETTFDISLTEWRTLAVIGERGQSSVNDVAGRTRIDKGWISRAVNSLVKRNLLKRHADTRDSRRTWLRLSQEGERIFLAASEAARHRNAYYLSDLSTEERKTLARLLDSIQERVEELGKE